MPRRQGKPGLSEIVLLGAMTRSSFTSMLSFAIKCSRCFIVSVICILIATCSLKILTVAAAWNELSSRDPLFSFLSNRELLIIVSVLELSLVVFLAKCRNTFLSAFAIAWISSLFLCYRIGLLMIGYTGGCSCTGGAESWVAIITANHLDVTLKIALGYMTVGSCLNLWNEVGLPRKNGYRSCVMH